MLGEKKWSDGIDIDANGDWVEKTGDSKINWTDRYNSSEACQELSGSGTCPDTPSFDYEAELIIEALSKSMQKPELPYTDSLSREIQNKLFIKLGIDTPKNSGAFFGYLHDSGGVTKGYGTEILIKVMDAKLGELPKEDKNVFQGLDGLTTALEFRKVDFSVIEADCEKAMEDIPNAHRQVLEYLERTRKEYENDPPLANEIRAETEEIIKQVDAMVGKSVDLLLQHAKQQSQTASAEL